MGKNEYQKLQANTGFFCSVNAGCFVLVPKYFLNNCGLENQVQVESIGVFQLWVWFFRWERTDWHMDSAI